MSDPRKVVHYKNTFDALHLDTSVDPGALLLEAYNQTVEKLMAELDRRGYTCIEDLRITFDVAAVVEKKAGVHG